MDVRKMSAIQLSKALDKASEAQSKIINAMIEDGRGRETPKETMTKNDPLSLKYQTSANHLADLYFEKNRRMTWHGSMKPIKYQENPTMATKEKRVFMMSLGEGKPKIPQFYDFAFTHYIPMNSHGGSSVAFKFVAHNDEFGNLVISEPESGKKFGGITYYAKAKLGRTDKALAKLVIEDTLQRVGATRVYEVLTKGRT